MDGMKEKDSVIDPMWILLDKCSTASVCCNEDLVRDVRECGAGEELTVITNGRKQTFKHIGVFQILNKDKAESLSKRKTDVDASKEIQTNKEKDEKTDTEDKIRNVLSVNVNEEDAETQIKKLRLLGRATIKT